MFRGDNTAYAYNDNSEDARNNNFGDSTAIFNVEGNIMSLIDSVEFTASTLTVGYNFYCLFLNCNIISAENLVLQSMEEYCYGSLFKNCRSLVTAPKLPATTLANGCYFSMFFDCRSLVTAPKLPATTLTNWCYANMFRNCYSLISAPVLPAATLKEWCYANMFFGCKGMNYIKCLATDISAYNCTANWVNYVTANGTFVKKAGVNWTTGTSGIPENWTVQDE